MATNPASATEVGFPYYTRLPPELKGEIWKQSLLSPGVHYFNFDGQRVSELGHGITDHDYAYVTAFAKSTDTSAWRVRNAISEVDEAASKTVKLFEKGTNMKKLFPLQPLRRRPADASVAMVDCDNDLVCFRILGKLVPTWDRPATATRFTGIKRVALEFKAQPVALEWPFPSHTHCCQAWDHELKPLCGQSIGIFLSNFPDLEEFYLIVKLTPWDCGMAPLGWAPMPGTKRTMVSAQLRRFRDFALQHKDELKRFEDKEYSYYEVVEQSTGRRRGRWRDIWSTIDDIQSYWNRFDTPGFSQQRGDYVPPKAKLGVVVHAKTQKLPKV
ncbi:hypothetical protein GGS26DRAFT_591184 [Hypomontagnella submonticulosa]|nr:hypothetical protein GGS26DRAFT_591184 [Hypomontagnella submonticulosa]